MPYQAAWNEKGRTHTTNTVLQVKSQRCHDIQFGRVIKGGIADSDQVGILGQQFAEIGSNWLSNTDITSCITVQQIPSHDTPAQHMTVELLTEHLRHDSKVSGSTSEGCRGRLYRPNHISLPETLRNSFETSGLCLLLIMGDGPHFLVICVDPRTKAVHLIDPFAGLRGNLQDIISNFYNSMS